MILACDVTQPRLCFSWQWGSGRRSHRELTAVKAAEILLPTMEAIRAEVGEPLEVLGVVRGPGSFTGIRVGLATALGLGLSTEVKVVAWDKYALAEPLLPGVDGSFLLPSGRDQVLARQFRKRAYCQEPTLIPTQALTPSTAYFTVGEWGGPDAEPLADRFTDLLLDKLVEDPSASQPLAPCYLRPPDAKRSPTLLAKLLENDHASPRPKR